MCAHARHVEVGERGLHAAGDVGALCRVRLRAVEGDEGLDRQHRTHDARETEAILRELKVALSGPEGARELNHVARLLVRVQFRARAQADAKALHKFLEAVGGRLHSVQLHDGAHAQQRAHLVARDIAVVVPGVGLLEHVKDLRDSPQRLFVAHVVGVSGSVQHLPYGAHKMAEGHLRAQLGTGARAVEGGRGGMRGEHE
mmetsp:Transcript_20764/g.52935  ORF Transcript_20764/g.52935 Transcript_20764/m.52935 type:complete len:200 (+) Transcript_20764:1819-2418(+)